ncbi:MAG: ribosomal L7Ae/L30e/S12e/Gadd45 family protein [Nanobdellota archaeon]
MELSKEQAEKVFTSIEVARSTGKVKKGINEVTKEMERANAILVAFAADANPPEITMHLSVLGKEKDIMTVKVPSKEELGAAAGLPVSTVAVAVVNAGDAKKDIEAMKADFKEE